MIRCRPCRGAYGGSDLMESGIREAIVGWDDFRNWHFSDMTEQPDDVRSRRNTGLSPVPDVGIQVATRREGTTCDPKQRCVAIRWRCRGSRAG
jgi:hypothetical protein